MLAFGGGANPRGARTGLYSLALPEPPVFDCRNAAGGVSALAGDDPFRGRSYSPRLFSGAFLLLLRGSQGYVSFRLRFALCGKRRAASQDLTLIRSSSGAPGAFGALGSKVIAIIARMW